MNETQSIYRPELHRLFVLLGKLRRKEKFTADSLADELQVSERTIRRDINYLRDMLQSPIEFDRWKRSFVLHGDIADFPMLQVSTGEMLSLYLGQAALQSFGAGPHAEYLAAAIQKLTAQLPQQMTVGLDTLSQSISLHAEPLTAVSGEVFKTLAEAWHLRRTVEMRYRKSDSPTAELRRVQPYYLYHNAGRWYLFGYCLKSGEIKTFRLDRMEAVTMTSDTFPEPDFDVHAFLKNSFGIYNGGEPSDIKIRFMAYGAQLAREKQWHPTQLLKELPDGEVEMQLNVVISSDLYRWIQSFGAEAEVLQPPEAREELRRVARIMNEMYG
ncbi:MAG: transcriptional regulator [Bacteroidota bacterium]